MELTKKETLIKIIQCYIEALSREDELNSKFKINLIDFSSIYYETIELLLDLTPYADSINWWIFEYKLNVYTSKNAYVIFKNGKEKDISNINSFVTLLLSKDYDNVKKFDLKD